MQQLLIDIYPLPGVQLRGSHRIKDHINLTGTAIKDIGFVPLGDLYTAHDDPDAIIIVGIKAGTKISDQESQVLQATGVKAYSYSLIEPALYAAANDQKLDAIGVVPKLPNAFKLFSANTGLKTTGKKDIGIIYSTLPCLWAGCFTSNSARAACVNNNISQLGQKVSALICNSGNANACTGSEGDADDHKLRELTGKLLGINPQAVLTASTGKIGVPLDMPVISKTIESIKESDLDLIDFAEAIMTTDLVVKVSALESNAVDGALGATKQSLPQKSPDTRLASSEKSELTIPSMMILRNEHNEVDGALGASFLGFAKGSGMIAPNMATMLAFILSDLRIEGLDEREMQIEFQRSLSEITARTFNRISVDGDTSTNDMVIFMSNCSGKEINLEEFKANLEAICKDLALKIIADGEGVSRIINLRISGYKDMLESQGIGNNIINSPLVKTALHGCDPNWGRIIAACGKNQQIELDKIELKFFDTVVFTNGMPTGFDKALLAERMRKNKFIPVSLNLGEDERNAAMSDLETSLEFWGTDLSYDYVKINAEYFT